MIGILWLRNILKRLMIMILVFAIVVEMERIGMEIQENTTRMIMVKMVYMLIMGADQSVIRCLVFCKKGMGYEKNT